MTKLQIEEILSKLMEEKFAISLKPTDYDKSFITDLTIDSLDLVEFFQAIENQFNIVIPDEVAEKITTFSQLLDFVEKQRV